MQALIEREGHSAVAESIRVVLARLRQEISGGQISGAQLDEKSLKLALGGLSTAVERQLRESLSYSLQPLINATGVILHTNLGRAPLAAAALDHVRATAGAYSNLEFDLATGERGKRDVHVDRLFQKLLDDALLSFETYTASLASKGDAIDSIISKADSAFESFDSAMAKIDSIAPGLAQGSADELDQKVRTIRDLVESFNKRSAAYMDEGRRSLLDISQAAIRVTRKFDPQAVGAENPPPRKPSQKRQ